jgi:hypothetical protein
MQQCRVTRPGSTARGWTTLASSDRRVRAGAPSGKECRVPTRRFTSTRPACSAHPTTTVTTKRVRGSAHSEACRRGSDSCPLARRTEKKKRGRRKEKGKKIEGTSPLQHLEASVPSGKLRRCTHTRARVLCLMLVLRACVCAT